MKPAPRRALECLALSIAGLGISAYLGFLHLALLRGELYGGPACGGIGSLFNCQAGAPSRFGSALGLPLSLWGILGYLATLNLALIAWQFPDWAEAALTGLVGLTATFLFIDAGLLVVMVTQIRLLCAFCLATYGINLLLLLVAKQALARPWVQVIRQLPSVYQAFLLGAWANGVGLFFWGVLLTGFAGVVAVNASAEFLTRAPGGLRERMMQMVLYTPRVQVETAGNPRLGPSRAPIQVVEFMDFMCPICQQAARFDAILLATHRNEVSLVLKQFPLDQSCNSAIERTVHTGACKLAVAAQCAHVQGKFWAFHDRMLQQNLPYLLGDLERDVARAGLDLAAFRECMASGQGLEAVARDVAEGARLKLVSTPAYVVNGVPILGAITPAQFEELVKVLRQSGSLRGASETRR